MEGKIIAFRHMILPLMMLQGLNPHIENTPRRFEFLELVLCICFGFGSSDFVFPPVISAYLPESRCRGADPHQRYSKIAT